MLRVLFIVLSVVSIALAIVLGRPLLYLIAAGLLISAGAMLTASVRRKQVAEKRTVTPAPPRDELKSLGIMEIRPKGAGEAEEAAAEEAPSELPATPPDAGGDGSPGPEPPKAKPSDDAPGPLFASARDGGTETPTRAKAAVRKRSRTPRIMVEGVVDRFPAEVVLPTLRALRASVEANTVTLLRQEPGALRYYVDAIVSCNAFARNGGRFVASKPLVSGARPLAAVVYDCQPSGEFDAHRLGYYHDSIAIHQVAVVPLTASEAGGDHYLLVADSMEDHKFDDETPQRLLRDFGRLIQSLVAEPDALPVEAPTGEPIRPRREIIAEEMARARAEGEPLSLALVYLNRAEAIGRDGSDAVEAAEAAFSRELGDHPDAGRVERFGELTYGLFRPHGAEEAAEWAFALQTALEDKSAPLEGGVSIGVAVLGAHHEGPDQLRSDATTALRESLESGECIVLE